MTRSAKLYLALVIAAGWAVLWAAWRHGEELELLETAAFVVVVALASVLKVPLPGVNGTLSVGFVFKLVALAQLGPLQTLVAGTAGALSQAYWKAERKPLLHQLVFNLSSVWISLALAREAFNLVSPWSGTAQTLTLVTAGGAYYLANTMVVAGIIALTENSNLLKVCRDCYFWSFPYYLVGGGIASTFVLCLRFAGWSSALFVCPIVYLIHRSYRLYIDRLQNEKDHAEELAELHLRTIEALAMAIEAKDQTTHDHLQRVKVYASEIGRELKLPYEDMLAVQAASLLHDIGKLAVPEHTLGKPGKLTKEEFEKVKIHPVVGAEILQRARFPYPVVPIVRSHHEKWDGSGYPDGIKGEAIPMGARIISAVDCLDALASDRQYRPALPLDKALEIVVSESGTSFDPKVVEILARRYIELEAIATAKSVDVPEGINTEIVVERGVAPAAGFEEERTPISESDAPVWSSIASARRESEMFFHLTRELGASLSLEETLETLPKRLGSLIQFDCLAVYTKSDDSLTPVHVTGVESNIFSSLLIPIGEGLSGWVAENNKAILNGNPAVEAGYQGIPRAPTTLRSGLAVPLEGVAGVIGVLALYSRESAGFSKEDQRVVTGISSRVGLAVENALKYREARQTATEDFLTGLPNARAMFMRLDDELSRSRRERKPLALVVCDLNGFKKVNDTLGHLEGNRILKEVAGALRMHCREYDLVARMGGDEFVLVFPGLEAETVNDRIEALRNEVRQTSAAVSVSVGVAFYPVDGDDAEQLLVEADARMYQDKRASKQQRPLTPETNQLTITVQ